MGIEDGIGLDKDGNPVTTPPEKLRYRVNRDDGTFFYVNKDMEPIDADGNVVPEPVIQKAKAESDHPEGVMTDSKGHYVNAAGDDEDEEGEKKSPPSEDATDATGVV